MHSSRYGIICFIERGKQFESRFHLCWFGFMGRAAREPASSSPLPPPASRLPRPMDFSIPHQRRLPCRERGVADQPEVGGETCLNRRVSRLPGRLGSEPRVLHITIACDGGDATVRCDDYSTATQGLHW